MSLLVVCGSYEGKIFGWDIELDIKNDLKIENINLTWAYTSHLSCIKCVAINYNHQIIHQNERNIRSNVQNSNNMLVSGGTDERIHLYDIIERKEDGEIGGAQNGTITCLEFYTNNISNILLCGSDDGKIVIWRCSDWNPLHILGGHKGGILSLSIHSSGRMALSSGKDRTLRLWNLINGSCGYIRRLKSDAQKVLFGELIYGYLCHYSRTIEIYNISNNNNNNNNQNNNNLNDKKKINCIAKFEYMTRLSNFLILNDNYIITGGDDKVILIHSLKDLDNNKNGLIFQLDANIINHNRIKDLKYIKLLNNKILLITISSNGKLFLWDLNKMIQYNNNELINTNELINEFLLDSYSFDNEIRLTSLDICYYPNINNDNDNNNEGIVGNNSDDDGHKSDEEDIENNNNIKKKKRKRNELKDNIIQNKKLKIKNKKKNKKNKKKN